MPKKKSLKERLKDPNSSTWRNKADNLWKRLVAVQWDHKCAVCGSGRYCQAHHLIPREMYSHRHVVMNGVLLCASHHKYSFELSPHKAPVEFFKWMLDTHPDLWDWLLLQKPVREKIVTCKQNTELLTEEMDKYLDSNRDKI